MNIIIKICDADFYITQDRDLGYSDRELFSIQEMIWFYENA